MSLTILSDREVQFLLHNLNRAEVEELQKVMRNALHEYATGTTQSGAAAENQPHRQVIESSNGTTTLFMPSTSSSNIGMKVVTLPAPASTAALESTTDYGHATTHGVLALMDAVGKPLGFVNAEELTAFRTALASSLLISRRSKVKTIVCFGCGKQAYWHVRLSLLLRGATIKRVHFVSREFNARATGLMKKFVEYDPRKRKEEGWQDCMFDLAGLNYGEIERILKDQIRASDVIFCSTPSTKPLFDHTFLTNTEGRKRARLIIAIGSYKPHMIEIPPEVISQAVKVHGAGHHFHKRAEEGGVIVVDSLTSLTTTGEMLRAGVKADKTVELGELVMLEHMEHEHDHDGDETPTGTRTPSLSTQSTSSSSAIVDSPSPHPSIDDSATSLDTTRSSLSWALNDALGQHSSSHSKSPSRKSSFSNPHSHSRKSSMSLAMRPRTGSMSSLHRKGPASGKKKVQTEAEDQMSRWLSGGNVIYKSVGQGIMDLVVGAEVVRLARSKNIGTLVQDF